MKKNLKSETIKKQCEQDQGNRESNKGERKKTKQKQEKRNN